MRRKHRFLSYVLAAALFLGLSAPIPASAASLYFIGLNDNVPPMTAGDMPFWSGGTLYVPYTVFDANLNGSGVNLGLYTSYSRSDGIVTLFDLRQMLVFDLNTGACRDEITGAVYSSQASMKNGRPFVSVSMVCSIFNLDYSYIRLPYISQGYLVRIKSPDTVLSDDLYISAAQDLINIRLKEYTKSLNSAATTTPGSSDDGQGSTQPGQNPIQEPDGGNTAVYLAFRCGSADGLTSILNVLDAGRYSALFFLSPRLIEEEGDLVRRILGTGHSMGVLAEGEDVDGQLRQGQRALEETAHTRTTLAYVPADRRAGLEAEGWVCWEESLAMEPGPAVGAGTFANTVLNRLGGRHRAAYLTLSGGEAAARVLPTLLRQLASNHYTLSVPLETRL
jgi:peptidoglycan/xylan/chitin deacetylase (PgdA/CDA1 family)